MKIKKISEAGWAHILTPLLVIAGIAVIGTVVLLKSHAMFITSPVPCSYNGRHINGKAEYNCGWWTTTPIYRGYTTVGTFNAGTNWILCQQKGVTYYHGAYYNYWWGYTLSNQNTWGWANAVYGRGGSNDGPFANVPNCNGAYGATPSITTS